MCIPKYKRISIIYGIIWRTHKCTEIMYLYMKRPLQGACYIKMSAYTLNTKETGTCIINWPSTEIKMTMSITTKYKMDYAVCLGCCAMHCLVMITHSRLFGIIFLFQTVCCIIYDDYVSMWETCWALTFCVPWGLCYTYCYYCVWRPQQKCLLRQCIINFGIGRPAFAQTYMWK